MLKVLCFCIVMSFYILQVKPQFNAPATPKTLSVPKVPAAPKAPSVPSSLASPKETSAPEISAALNPGHPTVDPNVNFNVDAGAGAPKVPDASKEPSTPKVSATFVQPTVDANVDLKEEACAPSPDVESSSKQYAWVNYNGTIPSNAMPASDDPNKPVYVGLAEPGPYNCTFAILPSQTQENFRCNSVQVTENDRKNILTVMDKKKFMWVPVNRTTFSNIDVEDLVRTNYQYDEDWCVGRMKLADGTFEVGDIIFKMFFSSSKNSYVSEGYEALVHSSK